MYYANFSTKLVKRNNMLHNHNSPLLIGNVDGEKIKEVREPSYFETYENVYYLHVLFNQLCYKILLNVVI